MKTLIINILVICVTVSCVTQRKQKNSSGIIGFEKYDNKTVIYVDFLNRDVIPEVLKVNYYDILKEKDFYKPESIVSKTDSLRTVQLKSKSAQKGYLYINEYSNDFITKNKDVVFIVGQDTVNTKERVMKLVGMKRSDVISVDTLQKGKLNLIRIN